MKPEIPQIEEALLLPYQQKLIALTDEKPVVFCEKSRRIGMTWGIAAQAALTSATAKEAKGMDTFYIGYNIEMTREFIDTCAMWAKAFNYVVGDVQEFIFKEKDEKGEDKAILAFRISFASGFEICALSSRPRSLRGRQGFVIIDEAAFHDELKEMMKSALALLIWGGKVLVISTHDGEENAFNEIIKDIRAGRKNYGLLRVDLDDALHDGLYKRICRMSGQEWSPAAEKKWRDELIANYGDDADEELFCAPRHGSGTFLPAVLIEKRMVDAPVVRLTCKDEFVFEPEPVREKEMREWCDEHLKPLLDDLDKTLMHYFGEDFARSGDLTVLWPLTLHNNLKRATPFVVELANVPFQQQEQIVFYILDRLPRFCFGAFDARGNGQALAEKAMQKYGAGRIEQVMITREWYMATMPKYKAAIEDGVFSIPKDAEILNDHRAARMIKGVAQIPETRTTGGNGRKRHGDALVAAVMAHYASQQEATEYDYHSFNPPAARERGKAYDRPEDDHPTGDGFHNSKGAW